MAKTKMLYEKKTLTKIVGVLDKIDDNYIITVEDRDSVQEYELEDILDTMLGTVLTISNEVDI